MASSSFVKLHSEWLGSRAARGGGASSTIIFLHGLLGNGRNLRTFARKLCEQNGANGLLVDLRGHGKSPPAPSLNTKTAISSCALDIHHTLLDQGVEDPIFVGHSLGGRVSLQYAYDGHHPRPRRLWLLDTVPGKINQSVSHTIGALQTALPTTNNVDRKEMARLLEKHGIDTATAQWLASSYKDGKFGFDLSVAQDLMEDFQNQDFRHQLRHLLDRNLPVDLVRGGRNPGWNGVEFDEHPKFNVHTLPDAGHWVHMDDLAGLLRVMMNATGAS